MSRFLFLFFILISLYADAAVYRQGQTVNLTGRFSENIFIAGGEVLVSVQAYDDLYVAGGSVNFDSGSASEFIGAAGQLKVNNVHIKDDVVAAGGEVEFGPETTIAGSLTAAGGTLHIDASIGEDAVIAGGTVYLSGSVNKDIKIYANKLVISSSAVIRGNLIYTADQVEIAPEAKILGQTIARPHENTKSEWVGRIAFYGFLFLLGLFLLPALLASLLYKTVFQIATRVSENFWENVGKGVVFSIFFPVVWILLLVSGIGIPLAMTLIFLTGTLKILVWTASSFTLGHFARAYVPRKISKTMNRKRVFWQTLLGTIIIAGLICIPILGWIGLGFLFIAVMGAALGLLQKYFSQN